MLELEGVVHSRMVPPQGAGAAPTALTAAAVAAPDGSSDTDGQSAGRQRRWVGRSLTVKVLISCVIACTINYTSMCADPRARRDPGLY